MSLKTTIKNWIGQYWIFRMRSLVGRNHEIHTPNPADLDFYKSFIQPGDLCFDVGANIGNKTAMFLSLQAKVIAIEPQRECVRILKHRFGNKITILQQGVGEHIGTMKFYVSSSHTTSSFSRDWIEAVKRTRFQGMMWDKTITVPVTTLDALIETYGLPRFIKIDVEGFEMQVLRGLTKPAEILCFEYTAPERLDVAVSCLQYLEGINKEYECNYTAGEVLRFVLPNWVSVNDMISIIKQSQDQLGAFGDIYLRKVS